LSAKEDALRMLHAAFFTVAAIYHISPEAQFRGEPRAHE
jgi:hypothetical protein